jgi:hypothetical protein
MAQVGAEDEKATENESDNVIRCNETKSKGDELCTKKLETMHHQKQMMNQ